eukprot:3254888-Rhodomonas_salina.2
MRKVCASIPSSSPQSARQSLSCSDFASGGLFMRVSKIQPVTAGLWISGCAHEHAGTRMLRRAIGVVERTPESLREDRLKDASRTQ